MCNSTTYQTEGSKIKVIYAEYPKVHLLYLKYNIYMIFQNTLKMLLLSSIPGENAAVMILIIYLPSKEHAHELFSSLIG